MDWSKCTAYKWTRSGKIHRLHVATGRDDLSKLDLTQIDSAPRQRWLDDARTFAPWHYQEPAMVKSPQRKLEVVPVFLKEQAHHLPADFTRHDLCSDRDRHRLLDNSWHKGVASGLFKTVLEHGMFVVENSDLGPADPSQCSSIRSLCLCPSTVFSHYES